MQTNVSDICSMTILQDRAPGLLWVLQESMLPDRGLSLSEVAAIVAVLERLVINESCGLLEAAHPLDERPLTALIDEGDPHNAFSTYLQLFEMGSGRGDHCGKACAWSWKVSTIERPRCEEHARGP